MSIDIGDVSPTNFYNYLSGLDYPADKRKLIRHARDNEAPLEIIEILERFPEKEYLGPTDVMDTYDQI